MPTDPTIKYFHVASRERALWLKYRSGALERVLVSIATHMRPKWLAQVMKVIMPRKMSRHAHRLRFGCSARTRKKPIA